MTKNFQLKPDHKLLNPDFEGYKLSLEPLPSYTTPIDNGRLPFHFHLSPSQYSVQHLKTYGNRDNLFLNQWKEELYYFDDDGGINRGKLKNGSFGFERVACLDKPSKGFPVPLSLSFPSKDVVIASDGFKLYFYKDVEESWKTLSIHDVDADVGNGAVLTDSCLVPADGANSVLHVVTQRVKTRDVDESKDSEPEGGSEAARKLRSGSAFVSELVWTRWRLEEDSVRLERRLNFEGEAAADFVAIDRRGKSLTVAAGGTFSRTDIEKADVQGATEEDPQTSLPAYIWSQTTDDVTLSFLVPATTQKTEVEFQLNVAEIRIGLKDGDPLLNGRLHGRIDKEGCSWTLSDSVLEVTLAKNQLCVWERVVEGDSTPETRSDSHLDAAAVHESLKHLTTETYGADPESQNKAYNSQELEECDYDVDEAAVLAIFDEDRPHATQQCSISGNQILFCLPSVAPSEPPCICLRHDVDGVVWQPSPRAQKDGQPYDHLATLHALGYVSASKTRRRFSTASRDFSFAVIADVNRHVYVYRQNTKLHNSDLRNRKSGKRLTSIAQQHVVSLPNEDDILGVVADSTSIYLLTSNSLLRVVVVSSEP